MTSVLAHVGEEWRERSRRERKSHGGRREKGKEVDGDRRQIEKGL